MPKTKKRVSDVYDDESVEALIEAANAWREDHPRAHDPSEQNLLDVLDELLGPLEADEDDEVEELNFDEE